MKEVTYMMKKEDKKIRDLLILLGKLKIRMEIILKFQNNQSRLLSCINFKQY
jgi:hypothetical protein